MTNEINVFMTELNLHRASLGMNVVAPNVGYKFTRLIDVNTNKTEMFIHNDTGDIYKSASNVGRAKGIRGNTRGFDMFSAGGLLEGGTVRHLKRGRPRKDMPTVSMDIETHDVFGGCIIRASTPQTENV